jgi:hypothetical protein
MTVKKRKLSHVGRFKAWRERYHLKPVISVLLYLIIPLVSIYLILLQYPDLGKARFYRMIEWIVPFGLALFGVTLVQERHAKGTRGRLGLDALFVALAMCWLFGFLGGRTVVVNTYDSWRFAVDVGPVVGIALFGTAMNFVHDVLEYLANNNGHRTGRPSPSVKARAAARRAGKNQKEGGPMPLSPP